MLNAATSEVARLVGVFVRRVDAELVASAARNAASGVRASSHRLEDEMRTLGELQALEGRGRLAG